MGTTLEFCRPGTFEPITDMVGGGPFGLPAGYWTDDTSMALCMADALLRCRGFVPGAIMDGFVKWWREGYLSSTGDCFDIGATTSQALSKYERTGNPMAGSTDLNTAGNGSIMRLAPIPIFFNHINPTEYAEQSSLLTHAHPECVKACRDLSTIISAGLLGYDRAVIEALGTPYGGYEPEGTGYVVDCLRSALWAFNSTDNFRDCILAAANLGNDSDTTAAVAGQIAGAYYGLDGIPGDWLDKLHLSFVIDQMAIDLFKG